jgi:hypothetical protein
MTLAGYTETQENTEENQLSFVVGHIILFVINIDDVIKISESDFQRKWWQRW